MTRATTSAASSRVEQSHGPRIICRVAEIALARASTDAAQLEREAADWQRELPLLEGSGTATLADLRDVEAPGYGAPALIAWASHAHA